MRPLLRNPRNVLLWSTTSIFASLAGTVGAQAQCAFAPSGGDDTYVCGSGTSAGGLTDLAGGDNTLLFPTGGTGTLDGNVVFGGGADTIEMNSGAITGTVDQGDGADGFVIGVGTVSGNVQQGSGTDDFQMTGGQIQSLNQGDNLDTLFMSGGRIIDFFDDGDSAVMTGGRIGRVNMKLDDNLFDMSGGTIDRNLVTGFGNDTIILSDGTIGGNISVSGGTDSIAVTGGSVGGNVLLSFGTDSFVWDGGGIIYGAIDLGPDTDTALLRNLTDANIGATTQLTGGLGVDALTFDNVATGGVARLQNFETIGLTNESELIFDETLVLGDSGTGTGAFSIDAASTIFGGNANGAVVPFAVGEFVDFANAGRIDLSNGDGTSDTFTITGNDLGDDGLLFLDTVLGDDASASDRLVISQGTVGGATSIGILNAGGTGAATAQDGILVVEATNGATTESGAFALTGRVAAGAYEYFLFKGGVSENTGDNWYLRSTIETPVEGPPPEAAPTPPPTVPPEAQPQPEEPEIVAPPPPLAQPAPPLLIPPDDPTPPDDPAPPVEAADPSPEVIPAPPEAEPADPPPPPPAVAQSPAPLPSPGSLGGSAVPLYRVEVPTYAVVSPAALHLARTSLGTFHERRGEQSLMTGAGVLPTSWGRVFGQDTERQWSGTVAPTFDGDLYGFQAGQDLAGWEFAPGHTTRLGLLGGYARMDGDVRGFALGFNDLGVGDLDLDGASFGGYLTHIAPTGWYLDGVVMGTWFEGDADSNAGLGIDVDGSGVAASLEGGYPIELSPDWSLEPQAQIIWQHLSLDDRADRFSDVSFNNEDAVTGRLGLRLQGRYQAGVATLRPYLKANIWHEFDADQEIRFGETPIRSSLDGTSLEFGGGVVAGLNESVSLFATADYTTDIDGGKQEILEGNIGITIRW